MGHRVNTAKTKRTIGLKKTTTKLPSVIEEDNFKISKLETEDVLSRLGDFPNYSVLFREAHAAIFSETGPLPVSTRHYIAFLVRTQTSVAMKFLRRFWGKAADTGSRIL